LEDKTVGDLKVKGKPLRVKPMKVLFKETQYPLGMKMKDH
jgi:hypothetical protein